MPWTLDEKHGAASLKRFLLVGWASAAGVALFSAWLTWGVWVEVQNGERTISSARDAYRIMVVLGSALSAYVLFEWWRDGAAHPSAVRRLRVAGASALLVCAAIPAAALIALPTPV